MIIKSLAGRKLKRPPKRSRQSPLLNRKSSQRLKRLVEHKLSPRLATMTLERDKGIQKVAINNMTGTEMIKLGTTATLAGNLSTYRSSTLAET